MINDNALTLVFSCVGVKLGHFCKYIEFWVEFVSLDSADQAWHDKYDCLLWQKLTCTPEHMSFNTGCSPGLGLVLGI